MPIQNNDTVKLPCLCCRKHASHVSVGDDQKTEDWRFDEEIINSTLYGSECC